MKRFICVLLFGVVLLTSTFIILNIKVTTRQGVNYQWHTVKIPLYLKILNFFDRHYNYKELTKRITRDSKDDTERILKIFEWTHQNIKRVPDSFPILDDHVWHIIVRGYGAKDQVSDVFTTLCNYAGIDAFYSRIYAPDKTRRILLSFAKIDERWYLFDPYRGVYFKDKKGNLADIGTIKSDNEWVIEYIDEESNVDYRFYFRNLPSIKDVGLRRSNIQSPLNRLLFEIRTKWK